PPPRVPHGDGQGPRPRADDRRLALVLLRPDALLGHRPDRARPAAVHTAPLAPRQAPRTSVPGGMSGARGYGRISTLDRRMSTPPRFRSVNAGSASPLGHE